MILFSALLRPQVQFGAPCYKKDTDELKGLQR